MSQISSDPVALSEPLHDLASLGMVGSAVLSPTQAAEWQPGMVPSGPAHAEVFASGGDTSGAALVLAFACDHLRATAPDPLADVPDERPWLWVQDREALRRTGRPYRPGLPRSLRHRLIHVAARTVEDALFALEEGLRCRELAFVIGEITGNPRALDMTASRRLSLAAEKHAVPLWLVRLDAKRDLSAARQRWSVQATTSPEPRWNPAAPGIPSWRADLFRARRHPPGTWTLHDDGALLAERFNPSAMPASYAELPPAEAQR
jgi:protein ImuA